MDLSIALIVPGIVAALAAWDLDELEATVRSCARAVDRTRLTSLHTKWLALALGSGMVLALLASIGNLQLPFALAAALAVILAVSLTRAARELTAGGRG